VPAQVSDWFARFSEPVRVRSRHPALVHYVFTIIGQGFRLAVTETGDMASLRYQSDVSLPEGCHVAITEVEITFCNVASREIEQ
jgi:hypothetical protein